jgi:hypothetical protein
LELFGFPYLEVHFDSTGAVRSDREHSGVLRFVGDTNCTDLLVLVHGWKGEADARRLYHALAARCADGIGRVEALAGRRLGLLGVLWPARTFLDDAFGGYRPAAPGMLRPADSLVARLSLFGLLAGEESLTAALAEAVTAPSRLDRVAGARRSYVDAIRGTLGGVRRRLGSSEEVPRAFFSADGAEVFDRLARPAHLPARTGRAVLVDRPYRAATTSPPLLGGARQAARNLLDLTAYLFMQDRASTVGLQGLAPLLRDIQAAGRLRLHLVGHSLGARAAAAACTDPRRPEPVTSLTLLQGAMSDVGFAAQWAPGRAGTFRRCLTAGLVAGPILVTHTVNDQVLAAIYAMAQCLVDEPATGANAGGRCGALGHTGARGTAAATDEDLRERDGSYRLRPGAIHNLRADAFVPQHPAVDGPEVANAMLSAISWSTA